MGSSIALDERLYYDTGFTIGELREEEAPYRLVLGDALEASVIRPRGNVSLPALGAGVTKFFSYFVHPDHFDTSEVEGISIPKKFSSDWIWNGDLYIRRFDASTLVEEFEATLGVGQDALARLVTFARYAGNIPPSMAEVLCDDIGLHFSLLEGGERIKELLKSDEVTITTTGIVLVPYDGECETSAPRTGHLQLYRE
tara:strand:+ start:101 stop:694 length:594 start_codon:yes stop_codon:yes gene_type:complete